MFITCPLTQDLSKKSRYYLVLSMIFITFAFTTIAYDMMKLVRHIRQGLTRGQILPHDIKKKIETYIIHYTMKRILLSLMIAFMSLTSYAQTESPHMTFKGVSIDGTLNDYVQKMKQKGFDYLGSKDGVAILTRLTAM